MKKNFKRSLIYSVLILLFASSCIPLKDYVYMQEVDDGQLDINVVEPDAYRIQPNDNLYIQVISNDELSTYFNLSSTDRYLNNDAAIELGSYKVSKEGMIDFPYMGAVKVSGLTTTEIKDIISVGVSEMLIQYSVVVKLVNRKVSLLGEFKAPGTYSFYNDRMTIFEALGMGGDLTDFGNRHNVKIIRHVAGEREVATVDLTKSEIFGSGFYYILPNDIIYVEPTNRVYGARTLPVATILSTINAGFNIYYFINTLIQNNQPAD